MRLTKVVIQQILDQNEGFKAQASFKSRNLRYTNYYRISNGQLHVQSIGRTSWSDSHFNDDDLCDLEQTKRFIKKNMYKLNVAGIE